VRIYKVKPRENRESVVMRSRTSLVGLSEEEQIKKTSPIFQNHKYANKIVPEKKKY